MIEATPDFRFTENSPDGQVVRVIEANPEFGFIQGFFGATGTTEDGKVVHVSSLRLLLDLKANEETICIMNPPVYPSVMETEKYGFLRSRPYTFTLIQTGPDYEILAIHADSREIYRKQKKHPTTQTSDKNNR